MAESIIREYREPMAVLPTVMGAGFAVALMATEKPAIEFAGKVAIVPIRGVLEHHASPLCDSYDAIKCRVAEALASQAEVVLLSIDSPGGTVSGAFDCSDELREMAAGSGKRLVAYVDGTTASAGYALACAAEQIVIPPAGLAGSIGVVSVITTREKAANAAGVSLHVIKSGKRKADGNPDEALDESGAAEIQAHINAQAGVFVDLVARARGLSPDVVAGWEGRVFVGADAVGVGLADLVASEDQLVAMLNSEQPTATAPQGQEVASMTLEDAKKALAARAEDQEVGEEERAKAKRALAALNGEDDEKKETEEEDAKAELPEDDKEEKKDDEAKAVAAKALALAESTARAQIMAERPDLTPESRANLAGVPLAELPKVLSAIPRLAPPSTAAVAAMTAPGTMPAGGESIVSPEAQSIIDRYRGRSTAQAVEHTETHSVFRAMTREQARAHLATLDKR